MEFSITGLKATRLKALRLKALRLIMLLTLLSTLSPSQTLAEESTDFSLEDLLNLTVTSVSKREERLFTTPSAVYVITQEDIRRSGYTTIAEALRVVPGIHVARAANYTWAISTRGFNSRFANKLLVLMDGRSVYTPFFGGTYWELQDTVMEDIERIEIIRGPGATVWGANAMNGVINIITRSAEYRQDNLISANESNQHQSLTLRTGGSTELSAYTLYLKVDRHQPLVNEVGDDGFDEFSKTQAGFRIDWSNSETNQVSLQGDFYDEELEYLHMVTTDTPPYLFDSLTNEVVSGGNFLVKWQHRTSDTSSFSLQFFINHSDRKRPSLDAVRDTVDLEFFQQFQYGKKHAISWGAGYRNSSDKIDTPLFALNISPDNLSMDLYSAFIQDKIELKEDTLWLTLGSKIEKNHYSGTEFLPSARMSWLPTPTQTVWSSISRAVQTPTRTSNLEINYLFFPTFPPFPIAGTVLRNNPPKDPKSQVLLAYELGYRVQASENLTLDMALFYNDYEDINVTNSAPIAVETFPNGTYTIISSDVVNEGVATVYGAEITTRWSPNDDWMITGSYSYLFEDFETTSKSDDSTFEFLEKRDPSDQFKFTAHRDLDFDLELDVHFYYVSEIQVNQAGSEIDIPHYKQTNIRLGWAPRQFLELSLGANNVFDSRHAEFAGTSGRASYEVPRSYYLKIKAEF
ncbi:MAG: hypothetical protein COA99_05075 [Moraxellaceae bacterium]|nr:MAG: hypothetical protein COA99_05075 [Moraxellaceae bacterium]